MKYKIVADSSSDLLALSGVPFESVPLRIITREREYTDDASLNISEMVEDLHRQTAPTGTSCPNVHDWVSAFGDADRVFAVTITSNLSGSCNACRQAAQMYMEEHPERRVCVLDSLSTGPEIQLIVELLRDAILAGEAFDAMEQRARGYMKHTHLLFCLKSLANLARNGRVSPAAAKLASVLGICVVGKASDEGTLELLHKCRGEKSALRTIYKAMKELGFSGGKVRISHCLNLPGAQMVADMIRAEFPSADVIVECARGLVCYYAEKGGMLIGFEG